MPETNGPPHSPHIHTILRPPWLVVTRLAWVFLAICCLFYFVYWVVLFAQRPLEQCTLPDVPCNPVYLSAEDVAVIEAQGSWFPLHTIARTFFVFNVLASLAFVIVALILVWRKSDDWMALLLSAIVLSLGTIGFSPSESVIISNPLSILVSLIAAFGYFAPGGMLFIFPDGRAVPRWARWMWPLFFLIFPTFVMATSSLPDPILFNGPLGRLLFLTLGISILTAIGCAIYRYRRVADSLQRQQIKWVAFGLGCTLASTFLWIFLAVFFPVNQPRPERTLAVLIGSPLLLTLISLFPISVAVAVLRYRLWDIDVIIRRTLIYSILTIVLALAYFGSVVLLQGFSTTLLGQQAESSELSIVASTLLIAALFTPLRRRVQWLIDRRFYRRKYSTEQVLARFATAARVEADVEIISEQLLGVIAETMQPKQMMLWLRPVAEDQVTK